MRDSWVTHADDDKFETRGIRKQLASSFELSWGYVIVLARGVGFEPTRPLPTTDLAGLPPTRLGQPRLDLPWLRSFLYVGSLFAFSEI